MTEPAPRDISSVSLRALDADPVAFADALGGSFERYGFAIVADHGIPPDLIARAEARAKAFFDLPREPSVVPYRGTGGARGYTPFGIETAKSATAFDLKEFWHIGRELPPARIPGLYGAQYLAR